MERVRGRTLQVSTYDGTPLPITDGYRHWNGSGTEPDPWPFTASTKLHGPWSPSETESSVDTPTPNFKARIAAGEIINNDFLRTHVLETHPPVVTMKHDTLKSGGNGPYGYKMEWQGAPFSTPTSCNAPEFLQRDAFESEIAGRKADVSALAVTSSHAKVSESEMLALATMYEGHKTIAFLGDSLKRVLRIAKAVRKLDGKLLRKELSFEEYQGRYMELRYAVRPLLYDINGFVAALQQERGTIRKTYRGWADDRFDHEDVLTNIPIAYETTLDIRRKLSYEVSARAGVLCDVIVDALTPWGLDQLIESVWDLTPFSFIVDWFANVGDTIAAWTPNAGVNQLASWVTVKETLTCTNSLDKIRSTAPTWYDVANITTCTPFAWSYKESVLERTANPSLSVWPQWKLSLDGFKLLDLSLVLKQVLRK